jgi:hypothetical protein
MEKFNLEYQWRLYLESAGLSLEKMHPVQVTETKRAFVAGMGQMFFLFQGDEEESKVIDAIGVLFDQLQTFWNIETQQQ